MYVFASIITELLLVSSCILILFNLRDKLGLAPLYILLGCLQYFQVNLEDIVSLNVFGKYPIYPSSVILFSAILFAVLLIYIKEGVASARTLIIGILISNLFLTGLFEITATQDYFIRKQVEGSELNPVRIFYVDYKFFTIGTIILLIDFVLLVSTYQLLITRFKKINFFFILFISLWTVLIFDALAFNTVLFLGTPKFAPSLAGHFIGKSVTATLYSIILYIYLTRVDKVLKSTSFITEQKRDIFSILKYRKKYLDLKDEKELAEKEFAARFENTLVRISDGVVSLDTDWNYTYVNKKAGELLGRDPDKLIGKHIWTEFPDGIGLPSYNAYYEAVNTQETQYMRTYYEPFDRWFENRIYPSMEGLTIYFSDITIQTKMQDALMESESFNKGILSSLSAHIAVVDHTGKILAVNKAWNDFSIANGESNLALTSVGSNYIEVCKRAIAQGDANTQKVLDGLKAVLEKRSPSFSIEYPCHSRKARRWFTLNIVPFGLELDKVVISHTNVTQLKVTEEQLENSNTKLKEAQRMSKIGSWEFDPVTKHVHFSDEMFSILDIDKDTTKNLYEAYRSKCLPEDYDKFNELVINSIKNEEGYAIGYYIKSKNDTVKYIHEICEVIKDQYNGNLILKGTLQDVTKDKLTHDELLQKNEDLQKVNIELDRFVYSASHDLRAPLTSLRGLIQILEMTMKPEHEELREPFSLMSTTIDKMDVFIKSIFDYSVNTRTKISVEEINFKELIGSIWESLKFMNIKYSPNPIINISQKDKFYSDKKRIEIILGNLVSNAIKYYDKDKLEHFVKISVTTTEEMATIIIEDNGIGIGKEHVGKIFEMFYRATKLSTGSGMGMYIVKETLDRLKGSIKMESEINVGTSFIITIPNSNE